jgi:hypothetical protein
MLLSKTTTSRVLSKICQRAYATVNKDSPEFINKTIARLNEEYPSATIKVQKVTQGTKLLGFWVAEGYNRTVPTSARYEPSKIVEFLKEHQKTPHLLGQHTVKKDSNRFMVSDTTGYVHHEDLTLVDRIDKELAKEVTDLYDANDLKATKLGV